uniref:Uncharacterized protein n=1 Tax=Oryza rufipogon TaxID=4529 RepID=A0A0E0NMA8_ORYRU
RRATTALPSVTGGGSDKGSLPYSGHESVTAPVGSCEEEVVVVDGIRERRGSGGWTTTAYYGLVKPSPARIRRWPSLAAASGDASGEHRACTSWNSERLPGESGSTGD